MQPFSELTYKWRASAGMWRDSAQDDEQLPAVQALYQELASLAEDFAAELDATVTDWQNEALTIKQAAQESGYSQEALRRAIRNGDLANAGRKGSPRIKRVDLPRKLNGASNG